MNPFRRGKAILRKGVEYAQLPAVVKAEVRRDKRDPLARDPGISPVVDAAIQWLLDSQEFSSTHDGGSARHYSLHEGWGPSYPETTGYIVPTLIESARRTNSESMLQSARKMADWLLSIQFEDGGFQGGLVNALPKVPVTFNTGQILLGLASAAEEFGEPYLTAMKSAAQWLVDTQDADGCWRRHPTPFASSGEKAYETHVAWGLFEAERVQPGLGYADAAIANVRWALSHQHENGWMNRCCLSDDSQPLTHTLGYCLRGLLEANRFRPDAQIFDGAHKLAQGLLSGRRSDGQLPGCFDSNWQGTVDWICLTGNVQVAHCFLMLSRETGDKAFAHAGMELNQFVRRTVNLEGEPGRRGGVKGSFPFSGGYGQYQFLNWAAKFFVDSNLLEAELKTES